ncbi:GvpL/GvpF family gas vesicle protein [Streptomyces sparsogenes]|uniref:Gas vesicle synthesis GvpLGvpF n=1 Tax=Streptomyces sparsogenes DSM 40356 TaxID=1331668 RepID=A0A1R1S9R0_9ACTN|nr:GvpL/GvpF family gas vesicle protein [Streptomyces sparsogenes]OMI34849.1 gas vesicle synthesis GvpLGvpF [Streptomyces sparsogenes DSM 40356]
MAEDGHACYVYGVVPDENGVQRGQADQTVKDVPVVGGQESPITFIRREGLAAVVSEVPTGKPLGTPDDLSAHARVLDTLAASGLPVLPFRFGTVVRDPQAVTDELLTEGQDDFQWALDRLRGSAQFTLRARYVQDEVLREVLEEHEEARRLREELEGLPEAAGYDQRIQLGQLVVEAVAAKRETDAREIEHRLAPFALGVATSEPASAEGVVNAAFLIEDGKREAFERAAEELAREWHGRVRLRLLGPQAPYDFVADALRRGDGEEGG